MNKNIAYLAMFASGVAIGSIASWIFAKKKYEQIAQEDFLSRKETLEKKKNSYFPLFIGLYELFTTTLLIFFP